MKTATFSDFVRHPTKVLAYAEGEDIRLTRREEGDLVVSSFERREENVSALELLARLIAATLDDETCDRLSDQLRLELPWIDLLPLDQRRRFVGDYFRTARSCVSVGEFRPLVIEIEAWKETARAYAEGIDPKGRDLEGLESEVVPAVPDPRLA